MAERQASLRRRLMAMLVGGMGLVWLALSPAVYFDARRHAHRMFDGQLAEYAEVLAAIAGHEAYEVPGETTSLESEHSRCCTYQVFAATGELLLRSHAAPVRALSTVDGFSDVDQGADRWRVFRHPDLHNHFVIVVAQRLEAREALVRELAGELLLPLLAGLPLVAFAIWFSVRWALAPLGAIAGDMERREAGHLAPVGLERVPIEVRPLVEALNRLFERVERSFDNERRFTGDAAHELRTPLAALRTQAEVAASTVSEDRRRRALEQLLAGVERATRLVDQMLALARLDAAGEVGRDRVDLVALAREQAAQPAAVEVGLEAPDALVVAGDEGMLRSLVRNLVDNAVHHAKGRVAITLALEGARACLTVEDDGSGLAPELRERIFDRFYRAPAAKPGGSGLGLSIARRVVELHHGEIAASAASMGGLRVRVLLPAAH